MARNQLVQYTFANLLIALFGNACLHGEATTRKSVLQLLLLKLFRRCIPTNWVRVVPQKWTLLDNLLCLECALKLFNIFKLPMIRTRGVHHVSVAYVRGDTHEVLDDAVAHLGIPSPLQPIGWGSTREESSSLPLDMPSDWKHSVDMFLREHGMRLCRSAAWHYHACL